MPRDTQRRFYQEINRLSPELRKQFVSAVGDISDSVRIEQVVRALERNDVNGALEALRGNVPFWTRLQEQLRATLLAGVGYTQQSLPRRNPATREAVVIRFDASNPTVAQWLRTESGALIQGLDDTRLDVAREVLSRGFSEGRNPRSVALDLVGRVDRATGRRTGGVIGLDRNQLSAILRLREKLEGEGLRQAEIVKRLAREKNKLLRIRGERIARTETLKYLSRGRREGYQALIDSGQVNLTAVSHWWDTALDGRQRDTHGLMNGQARPFDQPFQSTSGALLMHPGDTTLGAPASEIVNCRCYERIKIDWFEGVR